ncbi:hypothetical protein TNCV_2970141 [Trichonephila clavipes]|nr:hypothetical protein TNCV_2970141 [Trichonephila clavipes]
MRFCNISAYRSPVTVAVTKPESRISSKKKRPNNGRCGKSNSYPDFLVVQWSFHDSSSNFSSPNSAVVGVDRPSEREMSFVGPQQVTQPKFMMPMDFVRIASEGTPKCQSNSSVWNAGATCDCTGADFPVHRRTRYSLHFILKTVSAAFRRVLGRPLRGLSSKQPIASNFEIILATAAFVNGPLPLRIPFVWR